MNKNKIRVITYPYNYVSSDNPLHCLNCNQPISLEFIKIHKFVYCQNCLLTPNANGTYHQEDTSIKSGLLTDCLHYNGIIQYCMIS